MTNQELFRIVSEETEITRDVVDTLLELDSTASVTTQASLEELLKTLYDRLDEEDICIEDIGDSITKEEFKTWVEDNFDDYSVKLFEDEEE